MSDPTLPDGCPASSEEKDTSFFNLGVHGDRTALFFRVMGLLPLLLAPFVLLQVVVVHLLNDGEFMNTQAHYTSVALNLMLLATSLASWSAYRHRRRHAPDGKVQVRGLMNTSSSLLLSCVLVQVHLMGTMSSMHLAFFFAALLLSFWFMHWRDFLVLFLGAHLALVLIVWGEYAGFLPYSPLFDHDSRLGDVYLDWRYILAMGVNYLLGLVILTLATVWLKNKLERDAREREEIIHQLHQRVEQVQTLERLLPICAGCKSIRDDSGYWEKVEGYLGKHTGATFTHSMCPTCVQKYFPEFADDDSE